MRNSYNPIVENTQRDPSTPRKNPATGEWRLRTFDSSVYGSASDADLLAGKSRTLKAPSRERQSSPSQPFPRGGLMAEGPASTR